ncbi:helix-turn-helix domain-containing protein, partial [uncultured Ruminococcus sp.]
KEMLHFIQRHYAAPLTITVMAEQFHMSEKYFSRYFRIATGQNFTAYLNAVRIEKAQALLLETDETVLEIAFSCGYENVSYFNRVFRRQTGYSPLQYRSIAVS